MGDEAFRLDSKRRGESFVFTWTCAHCGQLLLDSTVSTSMSIEALERLEACDRRLLRIVQHQCDESARGFMPAPGVNPPRHTGEGIID